MVGEGGHTGGGESKRLLFTVSHGAQEEANTLFWGRSLPSIDTWYTKVKDVRSILSEHLGEVGQGGMEM